MKYLFFDIECSNCFDGVGKICEFGYVLTDENLKVIKASDIPMSPGKGKEARFHLKGRKHEKDLELAYEYDYYFSQPEFPFFYKQIKSLLEDKDTICFAYSMDNDISHLYHTCKRYHMKPFNFECYDIQKIAAEYLKRKGGMALSNVCREIAGPNSCISLQEHLSRDDAEMERLILESICILTKSDSKALLEQSSYARTNSSKWIDDFILRKKKKRMKAIGYNLYKSLVVSESKIDEPENVGRRYNLSGKLKTDLKALEATTKFIQSNNGIFSDQICKSDYFIVRDDADKEKMLKSFKYPFEGKILTYQELLNTMSA